MPEGQAWSRPELWLVLVARKLLWLTVFMLRYVSYRCHED